MHYVQLVSTTTVYQVLLNLQLASTEYQISYPECCCSCSFASFASLAFSNFLALTARQFRMITCNTSLEGAPSTNGCFRRSVDERRSSGFLIKLFARKSLKA